jgi:hypothetical protein
LKGEDSFWITSCIDKHVVLAVAAGDVLHGEWEWRKWSGTVVTTSPRHHMSTTRSRHHIRVGFTIGNVENKTLGFGTVTSETEACASSGLGVDVFGARALGDAAAFICLLVSGWVASLEGHIKLEEFFGTNKIGLQGGSVALALDTVVDDNT